MWVIKDCTTNVNIDSAKDTAKETLYKVIHPTLDPSQDTQQPENTGLERDMESKPQKVHLPSEGGDIVYTPSGKLAEKKALITGGDSGIGRAVAILFAMEGAKVAVAYLPSEEEDAQHTRTQIEKNDVAKRAVDALGGIDILVNNAATRQEHEDISDISEEQWMSNFRVNLDSYFHLTKNLLPHLSNGTVIINSASVDSYIGVPSRLDYATSKGAVVAFTRALSNQLVKKGIRVNAVAAGPVWTPLMATGVSEKSQKGFGLGNWTPMDRVGQPSETATSYVFLASQESVFMSGQTLHPNGGIIVNG
ncbi:unnamed protein product [Clonostachys chloroleuca]|uniref:Uncharacterized protein n=1 Tax=Clonostachys chloroleuca TaxID=1926264 RepID=A0AA35LUJ5_9HYPO|nr:unnamed protein product [Clonostachys chloroleuca]